MFTFQQPSHHIYNMAMLYHVFILVLLSHCISASPHKPLLLYHIMFYINVCFSAAINKSYIISYYIISYSNIVSYIKLAIYIVHRLINHYYYTILCSTSMVTLRFTYNICKYCIISPYYMSYHTVLPTLYNYIHISFVQYCSIIPFVTKTARSQAKQQNQHNSLM